MAYPVGVVNTLGCILVMVPSLMSQRIRAKPTFWIWANWPKTFSKVWLIEGFVTRSLGVRRFFDFFPKILKILIFFKIFWFFLSLPCSILKDFFEIFCDFLIFLWFFVIFIVIFWGCTKIFWVANPSWLIMLQRWWKNNM